MISELLQLEEVSIFKTSYITDILQTYQTTFTMISS